MMEQRKRASAQSSFPKYTLPAIWDLGTRARDGGCPWHLITAGFFFSLVCLGMDFIL